MTGGSPFPHLCLPQENLKWVLQNMRIPEQLCISLLSKKTMVSAREFCNFNRLNFKISISNRVCLEVGVPRIGNIACTFKSGNVITNTYIFDSYKSKFVVSAPQFNSKNWLKQLFYIFDSSKIDSVEFFRFDEEFQKTQFHVLKDSSAGMKIVHLCMQCGAQMLSSVEFMNAFLPTDRLTLEEAQPLTSSQLMTLRQAMSHNIEKIQLFMDLTLNNILLTGCSTIDIYRRILTDKEINMFLKHWIAGLKPELENFRISRHGPAFNRDIILKGIPYDIAPLDRKIKFRGDFEYYAGRFDIHLGKEKTAALVFYERNLGLDFHIAALHVAVHNSKYITLE